MQLDWITLYDYMSIFSRVPIIIKINKFYQSFYPLKFKKSGIKAFNLQLPDRVGFLGIIVGYIQRVLFALQVYLQAEYFLNHGKIKQDIKLSKMFAEIQKKNLQIALGLESFVNFINQVGKSYNGKSDERINQKGFLEIKIICSLNRLFEFFYIFQDMKKFLPQQGYEKVYESLKQFTFNVCQKSKDHIKLYPEMGLILIQILTFFYSEQKQPFNFHSHLTQNTQNKKKMFPQKVKKLFAMIPNKQKSIFVNLSDENFSEYLSATGFQIPKQTVENYFRCEEEINSIIAEEENFIESILVPEIYRGKPEWKYKVTQQLVNLSVDKKITKDSKLVRSKQFKFSDDFPLFINN